MTSIPEPPRRIRDWDVWQTSDGTPMGHRSGDFRILNENGRPPFVVIQVGDGPFGIAEFLGTHWTLHEAVTICRRASTGQPDTI